tara:strand:- start:2454 stop:2621 length:168 start_codon:yes stop_codon:yes gene_type:complete
VSASELKAAAKKTLLDLEMIAQVYPETLEPIRDYIALLESPAGAKKPKKAKRVKK